MKDLLAEALALDLPYSFRGLPLEGKESAVLALFAESANGAELLFTRRNETLISHSGQISFPGGRADPEDLSRGGLEGTALRELEEEVGVTRHGVEILGRLPALATPSGYRIQPFVGWCRTPLSELTLRANPDEIAEVFWVPLGLLRDPQVYRREPVPGRIFEGRVFETDTFYVGGHRVWGATGAMVKNLIDRLDRLRA